MREKNYQVNYNSVLPYHINCKTHSDHRDVKYNAILFIAHTRVKMLILDGSFNSSSYRMLNCIAFVRSSYVLKILCFQVSGFLPELRYFGALGPASPQRTGATGGFCGLERLRGSKPSGQPPPQLQQEGTSERTAFLPQPPPLSLTNTSVQGFFPLIPISRFLCSQARRESSRKEDPRPFSSI